MSLNSFFAQLLEEKQIEASTAEVTIVVDNAALPTPSSPSSVIRKVSVVPLQRREIKRTCRWSIEDSQKNATSDTCLVRSPSTLLNNKRTRTPVRKSLSSDSFLRMPTRASSPKRSSSWNNDHQHFQPNRDFSPLCSASCSNNSNNNNNGNASWNDLIISMPPMTTTATILRRQQQKNTLLLDSSSSSSSSSNNKMIIASSSTNKNDSSSRNARIENALTATNSPLLAGGRRHVETMSKNESMPIQPKRRGSFSMASPGSSN